MISSVKKNEQSIEKIEAYFGLVETGMPVAQYVGRDRSLSLFEFLVE